ncbi:MAG: class I SAM-dependent DNA methyltransferase [Candidatus Thorarchaeota archaeon]|jgi:SAM-dependent methyltransferase
MKPDSTRSYRDAAQFYDAFANNYDIKFYPEVAKRYGGPILELACGTGRVLLILAQLGYEITGIDAAEEMFEIARSKFEQLPEETQSRVNLQQGSISDFDLGRKFSLIIIPSSFKFNLTTENQLACLKSVRKHLDKDGVFILDHYPGALQPEYEERMQGPVKLIDGTKVRRHIKSESDLKEQLQRFIISYKIETPNGLEDAFVTESGQALIYEREIELLIQISGFKILEEYGDWDFSQYELGCERRIFVLQSA